MGALPVQITPAGIDDERDIVPLMAAFNDAEGIPWRPAPMGAALQRLLGDASLGLILVARDRATRAPVGYGLATFGYDLEFAGADAFITELFVDPALRGRGVGRSLLEALVQALQARGANAVHLMVRPENERARSLYAKLGFHTAPRIMMTRRLGPGDA
jgi:ribosomal protein S18 acetylase RimI-like enzyme